MNRITITTTDGKQYYLSFNRKTAAMYGDMGHEVADLSSTAKGFDAAIDFLFCAFKTNHSSIKRDKVETIWNSVKSKKTKNDVMNALIDMYADTYTNLIGDPNANDEDDEGNAATVEFDE